MNNNQELVEKLETMRTLMHDTFLEITARPKLSARGAVQSVLGIDGLSPRDKIILLDLVIHAEDSELQKGSKCQQRLKMTRQEYNNGSRRLQALGYVKQVKRGFYQINPIF